ncbi:hypothetical protein E3N88_05980 [Mikania micrantha]|uniref:Uncharacterized protein n=1 Tax=Mikania micrantha TaxID=192012 RepID=A0A5N6PMG0_9ASTR|nr:hypothetical protein E3N88_05980 [Mikania micrantha]
MSSSSSTPGNDKKSRLTSEILKQYNKDVLYMDVLKQSFESLDESIKKRDKLSKKLLQLPPTAIRDLVILFMIDEDAIDVQQLHLIADIIQKLRCSMKLKMAHEHQTLILHCLEQKKTQCPSVLLMAYLLYQHLFVPLSSLKCL